MSGKKARILDGLSTMLASVVLGAGAYWFMRLVGAPHWACWLAALLVYLQVSQFIQLSGAKGRRR